MPTTKRTDQDGVHRGTQSRDRRTVAAAATADNDTNTTVSTATDTVRTPRIVTGDASTNPTSDSNSSRYVQGRTQFRIVKPIVEAEAASLTSNRTSAVASPSNSDGSRLSLTAQLAALHLQSDSGTDNSSVMVLVVDATLSALLTKVIKDKPGDQVHLSFIAQAITNHLGIPTM